MNKLFLATTAGILYSSVALAGNVSGFVQDHYKSVVKQTPHNQQVCHDVVVPNRVGPDNLLSGAIIGGIIGNNVTKNVENGGAVGALLGGILGHNNQQAAGSTTQTRCSTRTTYTETQSNVYSHSTISFTDDNGVRRTVKFFK